MAYHYHGFKIVEIIILLLPTVPREFLVGTGISKNLSETQMTIVLTAARKVRAHSIRKMTDARSGQRRPGGSHPDETMA